MKIDIFTKKSAEQIIKQLINKKVDYIEKEINKLYDKIKRLEDEIKILYSS